LKKITIANCIISKSENSDFRLADYIIHNLLKKNYNCELYNL